MTLQCVSSAKTLRQTLYLPRHAQRSLNTLKEACGDAARRHEHNACSKTDEDAEQGGTPGMALTRKGHNTFLSVKIGRSRRNRHTRRLVGIVPNTCCPARRGMRLRGPAPAAVPRHAPFQAFPAAFRSSCSTLHWPLRVKTLKMASTRYCSRYLLWPRNLSKPLFCSVRARAFKSS